MASKKRERKVPAPSVSPASNIWDRLASPRTIFLGLAAAVLLFYFKPLFSGNASIQWDAVDVQYSAQNHLSEMLRTGKLPQWTPYVFSGMPFLADPQVGAWYPLNWPFFLAGITPRAIEWQLALHCLLAAMGGYLLGRDLLRSRAAAVFAGIFFAFSGVFAAHSSHPGIFQAASLAPWLLWTGRRAASASRWLPALGMVAGAMILTGHFQTALYAFFALAIFLAVDAALRGGSLRGSALAVLVAVAVAVGGGAALSAVMVLPGLELTAESVRANADYSKDAGASLAPGALATLVIPDHYGAVGVEHYSGPQDITQFYFYMGILLVPLALVGLTSTGERWYGLVLTVAGVWYAMGPAGGLYSLVSVMPGFHNVRAPVNIWFVAALGLALLAAAGVGVLRARFRSPWIMLALLGITGLDLYYWNMERNGLTYARESFQERYGSAEDRFRTVAAPLTANPMHRIWAANASPAFGPLNSSLDNRMEVTFGYNPLELARYKQYIEAAAANPKLLNGLAVTATLNSTDGHVPHQPGRAAADLRAGNSIGGARQGRSGGASGVTRSGARSCGGGYRGDSSRMAARRCRSRATRATFIAHATRRSMRRCCVLLAPYFPGWQAEVDGRATNVVPVDVALMGVVVPAGDHELVVRYRPTWFAVGAAISGVAGRV